MADKQQPVIIIRRKKGGGHAGHHGGAWKVAYADFVTAMMAFFLLLWLLNVTTDTQRRGLADYFSPVGLSKSSSGAGGMLAGQSLASPTGAQFTYGTPPTVRNETITPSKGKGEDGDVDTYGMSKEENNNKGNTGTLVSDSDAAIVARMKSEEELFKTAESTLKKMLVETPGFKDIAQQLLIDRTPEGLRIQIVDRDKFSMFPSGSAIPYEKGRDLLRLVGAVIARLPNSISITGHTDASPFMIGSRRDNWGLSSERANESRYELVSGGVQENRIARVVGMADREPLIPSDPVDPRNRRISIVLLRTQLTPAKAASPEPSAPPSSSAPSSKGKP